MSDSAIRTKSAPVLVIFVKYREKFLLVKRSPKVMAYQNLWSCLAGYIDDNKTEEEKVRWEIVEELGLQAEDVKRAEHVETYLFIDEDLNQEWTRSVWFVEVSDPNIKLDWDHSEYVWVSPEEIKNFEVTPGLAEDLKKIIEKFA